MYLEWFDTPTALWHVINDLDVAIDTQWNELVEKKIYSSFAFTPAVSSLLFKVVNFGGRYSENSGTAFEGILVPDRKIRVNAGYILDTPGPEQSDLAVLAQSYFHYMKYQGGSIVLDQSNAFGGTNRYFTDFFNNQYSSGTYSDSTYTPTGYSVTTYDSQAQLINDFTRFKITTNHTKGKVYWRTFDDETIEDGLPKTSAMWNFAGATVNGTLEVPIASPTKRFLRVAVVVDGTTWSEDIQTSAIEVFYNSYAEFIYRSVFFLDKPLFPEPDWPEIPRVTCGARDVYKRAIENEVNLKDYTAGETIQQIIKDICDDARIPYSATSIANLNDFGNRVLPDGLRESKFADPVFDHLMDIVSQDGMTKYRMFTQYDNDMEDTILFVQPRVSSYDAVFVMNYKYYTRIGDRSKNYDKIVNRFSISTDLAAEVEAQETLDSDVITIPGSHTFTWTGEAFYKRFKLFMNSGTRPAIVVTDVTNTSITILVGAGTFNMTISVLGSKFTTPPAYSAEWLHFDNNISGKGQQPKKENKLLISAAEAKAIVKGFVLEIGDPSNICNGLDYPYLNLLPEANDTIQLLARYLFDDNLYRVLGRRHLWKYTGGKTTFDLEDSGLNFSDIFDDKWDEGQTFDNGNIWDKQFGPQVLSDPNTYENLRPVEFS